MIKPIRNIISVYTTVSIIISAIFPIGIDAQEVGGSNNGSNIVFSGSEMLSEPIVTDSTGTSISEIGIINTIPVIIDNGSGGNSSGNIITESGNISDTSIGIPLITGDTVEDSLIINSGSQNAIDTGALSVNQEKEIHEENHPEIEILIQFKGSIENTVGEYQVNQIESIHNLKTTDTIPENNIAVMTSTTPEIMNSIVDNNPFSYEKSAQENNIENIINELKNDPRIEHVQRNYIYDIESVDDPDYPKLWGLNNSGQSINGTSGTIDADIDYPEAIIYASGSLGTGVIVAVLDTGIDYNHPDLAGHMWDGTNCLSDTGASLGGCIHGYDYAYDDSDPNDIYSHGSHVAGTIGAITNNTLGTTGIAPNVTIMAVKILDDTGRGSTVDIIRGINFAKYNGAKVINASFGGIIQTNTRNDFDFMTYDAIKNFPGIFVAAAGNNGRNLETLTNTKNYPSGFGSDTTMSGEVTIPGLTNVISVAASNQNDNLASFSNYGTGTVHIAAPGTNIWSTIPGGYRYSNGTSMATPHVTGAAVLAWSYRSTATIDEISSAIIQGGDTKSSLADKILTGKRLNIAGMLQILGAPVVIVPPVTPPPPSCNISISPNSITNGSGAILTWSILGSLTGSLTPGNTTVGSSGSIIVTPPSNTTTPYTLNVTNSGGSNSCIASITTVPVVVAPPPVVVILPPTCNLSLSQTGVANGSGITLSWSILGSLTGSLTPGNTILGSSGSIVIIPPSSTTTLYTLNVTNSGGSNSCMGSVTATPPVIIPPPAIIIPPVVTPPIIVSPPPSVPVNGPGGGYYQTYQVSIQDIKTQEPIEYKEMMLMNGKSTKTITGKISSIGRLLNTSIRILQKKLNSNTIESSILRRDNILSLQYLYREQILFLRSRNKI